MLSYCVEEETYLESCVYFWFGFIITDDVQKLQCIFCSKVLGNVSVKPPLLKARFTSRHPTHLHENHISLLTKLVRFRAAGTLPTLGFVSERQSGLEATYRVAFRKAKENRIDSGNDLTNRTLWIFWNWSIEQNKRRSLRKNL